MAKDELDIKLLISIGAAQILISQRSPPYFAPNLNRKLFSFSEVHVSLGTWRSKQWRASSPKGDTAFSCYTIILVHTHFLYALGFRIAPKQDDLSL